MCHSGDLLLLSCQLVCFNGRIIFFVVLKRTGNNVVVETLLLSDSLAGKICSSVLVKVLWLLSSWSGHRKLLVL